MGYQMRSTDFNTRDKAVGLSNCIHWARFKFRGGFNSYAHIMVNVVEGSYASSVQISHKAHGTGRSNECRVAKCWICCSLDSTIYACLHCMFFGCLRHGHSRAHYKTTQHMMVANHATGALYCFKCSDFIYDPDLIGSTDLWRRSRVARYISYAEVFNGMMSSDRYLRSGGVPAMSVSLNGTFGMRGLVNLGHTCFMNCIIQALMHTPLLRDYFLAEKIECRSLKHDAKQHKACMVTPISELFQDFYDGSKTALSLHKFLPRIWDNAVHLAGYEQQDAHEFFIAILDALHLHFASNFVGISNCNCVVDVIFLGRLQSAVTCTVCGHKSITVDPFWDTSLDLISDPTDPKRAINLEDVLKRFTKIEHLGPGSMIQCADCGRKTESTKQLRFHQLPAVLCLHLKRFEHSNTATCKKIDTCVRFPEILDVTPFVTHTPYVMVKNQHKLFRKNYVTKYLYSLYAVVNHIGSFEGGHYYAYIRHEHNQWYKCDDHIITKASLDEVLNSPGYLLFYHKTSLEFKDFSDVESLIDGVNA